MEFFFGRLTLTDEQSLHACIFMYMHNVSHLHTCKITLIDSDKLLTNSARCFIYCPLTPCGALIIWPTNSFVAILFIPLNGPMPKTCIVS